MESVSLIGCNLKSCSLVGSLRAMLLKSLAEKLRFGLSENGLLPSAFLMIMDAVYGETIGSDGLPEKLDDSQRVFLDREKTRGLELFLLYTSHCPLHLFLRSAFRSGRYFRLWRGFY